MNADRWATIALRVMPKPMIQTPIGTSAANTMLQSLAASTSSTPKARPPAIARPDRMRGQRVLVVDERDVRRDTRGHAFGNVVVDLVVEGDRLLERPVAPGGA